MMQDQASSAEVGTASFAPHPGKSTDVTSFTQVDPVGKPLGSFDALPASVALPARWVSDSPSAGVRPPEDRAQAS